jgi:nitrite reductase/ring-hydroxylating ferredoxin subunit
MAVRIAMAFVRVARMEDIPDGQTRFFELPSGPVLLANYQGSIYAVSGICSHQLKPLAGAAMLGPLIDCPWHNFQFDCRTGKNHPTVDACSAELVHPGDQVRPLKKYPTEVRNGDVWVEV